MTHDVQHRAPRRLLTGVGLTLLGLLMAALGAWGVLAIAISGPGGDTMRTALAVAFGAVSLGALIALWSRAWRWRADPASMEAAVRMAVRMVTSD